MVDLDEETLRSAGPEGVWGNVEPIFEADDLPAPINGFHDLSARDNRAYLFCQPVTSDAGLRLGAMTPLVGWHGGISMFNYTGTRAAIKAVGDPVFMDRLTVTAGPSAKIHNIEADAFTEHLVTGCSFVGGDLGRIHGYRVPSFKTVNFEGFTSGLTFTGTSKKILVKGSPFRSVSTDGVTCLTFDADCSTEIAVIDGCYVKNVQSDTEVVRVDPAGMPSEVFQYLGTTHGPAVTEANILNGAVGIEAVGTDVKSSYPLRNSAAGGEFELDNAPVTTTISSAATPVKVEGTTTARNAERFELTADNEFTYRGQAMTETDVAARLSVSASNTTVRAYIALNGAVQGAGTPVETSGTGTPVSVTEAKRFDLKTGDTLSVYIANEDGTGDITVDRLSFIV